jgi:5-methyltetrahydrofolate--homocysteine methyltransferase
MQTKSQIVTTQAVIASEAKQSPSRKEEIASSQKTLLAMTRAEQLPQILEQIASNLYKGENEAVADLVQQALDQEMAPADILNGGLIAGMDEVGKDFKAGELFVPEVLIAARAMHAGMNVLRPLLAESDVPSAGKYVIGTVQGDLHDIGKNLVKMMLEGAGFETIDLGTDVRPDDFVAAVQEHHPQLLGMSALLTTTMPGMKATIEALEEAGLRDVVKIMIGGAPVTAAFAEQIGADAYAPDAATAVDVARSLVA